MGISLERFAPTLQSDPQISSAVGTGLDSITAGIQSSQSSGLSQVADSMDKFAACFPPIGTAPSPEAGVADSAAISSADLYFAQAAQAGDVNGFSDLAPMNQVLTKLSDQNFDYQTSLQDFANALNQVQIQGNSQTPQTSESTAISGNAPEPGGSQALALLEDNESQAARDIAESGAMVDGTAFSDQQPGASHALVFLENNESGALAEGGLIDTADKLSDAQVSQGIQNLQGALREILDLNQGGQING